MRKLQRPHLRISKLGKVFSAGMRRVAVSAFETKVASSSKTLFHGTRLHSVRSILRHGLIGRRVRLHDARKIRSSVFVAHRDTALAYVGHFSPRNKRNTRYGAMFVVKKTRDMVAGGDRRDGVHTTFFVPKEKILGLAIVRTSIEKDAQGKLKMFDKVMAAFWRGRR